MTSSITSSPANSERAPHPPESIGCSRSDDTSENQNRRKVSTFIVVADVDVVVDEVEKSWANSSLTVKKKVQSGQMETAAIFNRIHRQTTPIRLQFF